MSDDAGFPDLAVPPPGTRPAPSSLEICLTGRCNLRCRYCAYANEMTALADLPTERWLAFFREAGELAVQRAVLSGGEVFTRPDLFELIDGLIENRMRYSLSTNATLVDERQVAAFEVGKRRLRLDGIQVSIDGSCAEVHDECRPPASFHRALRGLRLLKEAGLPVSVRVTVNRRNVGDLESTARLLLEEIGLPSISVNEAEPLGAASCAGREVLLTGEERRQAMSVLLSLDGRYPGRIGAMAGPLSEAREFREIRARLERGEKGVPGRGFLPGCAVNRMAVLHDGTMVPCNLLPTLTMGVIGVQPLRDVWLRHPAVNAVRYRRRVPLSSLPECEGCAYTACCPGSCPGVTIAEHGRLNARDPRICYRIFVGEEPPPGSFTPRGEEGRT